MTEPEKTSGSAYENYNQSHSNYELTRLPVGAAQVLSMLQSPRRKQRAPGGGLSSLEQLTLLDAGCGTGMHLEYFQKAGVGHLIGVDASLTGVQKAREKLTVQAGNGQTVSLLVGDMRTLPLADSSVDVVLISFAVHHLPHSTDAQLIRETSRLFAEANRVLKPGGRLFVISTSRTQLDPYKGSLWYYRYFQDAARALSRKFLPARVLRSIAEVAGLQNTRIDKVETTYWTDESLNQEGPFRQDWRDGDSLFAFYRGKEDVLAHRLQRLTSAIASGAAQKHIKETRSRTDKVKQAYILSAEKPA